MPFVRDCRIEGREIDGPHRLRAQHEWIMVHAFAIDLGLQSEIAQPLEACFRRLLDAAVEKMHRCQVARILQRAPQGQVAAGAAVVVLRRPVRSRERRPPMGGSVIGSSAISVLGCKPLPSAAR